MKHPLLILALSAIATFTMGWFGHRVFSKSMTVEQAPPSVTEPVKKIDSPPLIKPDTLLVKKTDSVSIKMTDQNYDSAKPNIILASATSDTLWNDEKEIILKSPDGGLDIKRKFKPNKTFKDYTVTERFKTKPVKELDFSTSKYGKLYKKALVKALNSGPVFAGRFSFVKVECGMGCLASTLIDLKTGKVYDGPHASTGYQYKINSRLLIINPPPADGLYSPCDFCEPEMYVWTGSEFKKL